MRDTNDFNDGSGYRKYDLGHAIDHFAHVMKKSADHLTDAQKQKIANLTRCPFCAVKPIKIEYTTTVIPYFIEHSKGFSPMLREALRELCLAHDIVYSNGVTTKDRFALNKGEMVEIVKAFRAARKGRFHKPTWCPDYIDDNDKMKAFVFAYMTDINYHSERKILEERGVEAFAKVVKLWGGEFDVIVEKEEELLNDSLTGNGIMRYYAE